MGSHHHDLPLVEMQPVDATFISGFCEIVYIGDGVYQLTGYRIHHPGDGDHPVRVKVRESIMSGTALIDLAQQIFAKVRRPGAGPVQEKPLQ